jgi:hypothetical protein
MASKKLEPKIEFSASWDAITRFASGSFQAELAYELGRHPERILEPVQVLTADGSWQSYHAIPLVSHSNSALNAYVLVPTDTSRSDVKVIFRGTEIESHDVQDIIGSFNINLEIDGAGSELWAEDGAFIMAQFENIITNAGLSDKSIQLEISGHSQGGAFTQYFTTDLMTKMLDGNLSNITHIQNNAYNPTGIDDKTEACFEEIFPLFIEQFGNEFFNANIGHTHGDIVQQTGEGTIWEHIDPSQAVIEMMIIDKGLKQAWAKYIDLDDGLQMYEVAKAFLYGIRDTIKAHKNNGYFAPTEAGGEIEVNFPFQHLNNQTPEGATVIQTELTHKQFIAQYALKPLKVVLHDFLTLFEKSTDNDADKTPVDDLSKTNELLIFSDVLSSTNDNHLDFAKDAFCDQMGHTDSTFENTMLNHTMMDFF